MWKGGIVVWPKWWPDEEYVSHYSPTVDGLNAEEAIAVYEVVSEEFPSVNWVLPGPHADVHVKNREESARWSIGQLAKAKNQTPPDPKTLLISGAFHEALTAYEEIESQRLSPGPYLVKLYIDQTGKLKNNFTAELSEDEFVGQVEVESR